MTTVTDLLKRLRFADNSVHAITASIINKNEEKILDLIRLDQIFKQGIQGDGSPLVSTNTTPGVYSALTEEMNAGNIFTYNGVSKRKIRDDRYFLFNEGTFFRSIELITDASSNLLIISSDHTVKVKGVNKTMEEEYGLKLLFLTEENEEYLNQEIIKKDLWQSLIDILEGKN